MPQYHPIQPPIQQIHPQIQPAPQTNANLFPSYGQFPSTYPYNTLNPQFFQQNYPQPNPTAQPTTVNPSAGMYAPIPFVNQTHNQSLRPGMQNLMTMNSNGLQIPAQNRSMNQVKVEMSVRPVTEGVYSDDTRNVKRPKIEPKCNTPASRLLKLVTAAQPKELAPKPKPPKVALVVAKLMIETNDV